jgi:CopG family nickel-responsive transcriptional regulator
VHLDEASCLEVTVLKGRGAEVQSFANQVIAERGVRHGHVVYVPAPNGAAHSHSHAHGHSHRPKRPRRRRLTLS